MLMRTAAHFSTAPGRNAASPRQRVVAFGLKENVAKLAPITDIARVRIPALGWSVENVEVGHVRAERDNEFISPRTRALLPTSNTQVPGCSALSHRITRVCHVQALMCTGKPTRAT